LSVFESGIENEETYKEDGDEIKVDLAFILILKKINHIFTFFFDFFTQSVKKIYIQKTYN